MSTAHIGTVICVHDDRWFLKDSIASFAPAGPVFVFVTRIPWSGPVGDWERSVAVAESAGAEVIVGDWPAEVLHRQGAVQTLIDRGFTHAFVPNSDEIIDTSLLDSLVRIANSFVAQRVYVEMQTYWKRPDVVLRQAESYQPLILLELAKVWPDDVYAFSGRLYGGGKGLVVRFDHGLLHHLSYVGPDERIQLKLARSLKRDHLLPHWWDKVWQAWDDDPLIGHLNPVHPPAYLFAERIERPPSLCEVPDLRDTRTSVLKPNDWPTVSAIVVVDGNPKQTRQCLSWLEMSRDLLDEVILIDNASVDGAGGVAAEFLLVNSVTTAALLSRPAALNLGIAATHGDVVLLLNSDVIVPRAGLIRLGEAFACSGMVAAAAPITNRRSPRQHQFATYTSPDTLGLFAEDFAHQCGFDSDLDACDDSCVMLRRSVLEELGVLDSDFSTGQIAMWDLCYRLRRSGYRIRLQARSFIHIESTSPESHRSDGQREADATRYEEKWRKDLERGVVNVLPGLNSERVCFDHNRVRE